MLSMIRVFVNLLLVFISLNSAISNFCLMGLSGGFYDVGGMFVGWLFLLVPFFFVLVDVNSGLRFYSFIFSFSNNVKLVALLVVLPFFLIFMSPYVVAGAVYGQERGGGSAKNIDIALSECSTCNVIKSIWNRVGI